MVISFLYLSKFFYGEVIKALLKHENEFLSFFSFLFFSFILFYFILFYFVLFYYILFYFIFIFIYLFIN